MLTASRRRRSCSRCRWRSRSDTEFVNAGDIEFESDAGDELVDLPWRAISSYGLCLRVLSTCVEFNSSSSLMMLCFSNRCRCSCLRSCATFNCFSRFSFSLACLRNCSKVFSVLALGKNPVFELLLDVWLDQEVIDFCLGSVVGACIQIKIFKIIINEIRIKKLNYKPFSLKINQNSTLDSSMILNLFCP